jgi:hypothetical protein
MIAESRPQEVLLSEYVRQIKGKKFGRLSGVSTVTWNPSQEQNPGPRKPQPLVRRCVRSGVSNLLYDLHLPVQTVECAE